MRQQLPSEIESYRDITWQRELSQRVESVTEAEQFIRRVGFSFLLTDQRQPGPSLYIAVCGRRDAQMPRNVQKDPEASLTWRLKDELVQRGRVYYGKLARGKAMCLGPKMIPYFFALWGIARPAQRKRLSEPAKAILKVLRKEWEMATSDLRTASGIADRRHFARGIDELQAAMIVMPSEVVYVPKFTYIWTLAEGRFPDLYAERIDSAIAVREIARCFLGNAGLTVPGELARVVGISRPLAGLGNRALVTEGYASSPTTGTYLLADLSQRLEATLSQ
ncbi:MAG: hypothetical protein ABI882_00450 [Acidobacteriota bacterium]